VKGGKERRWEGEKVRRWEKAGLSNEDKAMRTESSRMWKAYGSRFTAFGARLKAQGTWQSKIGRRISEYGFILTFPASHLLSFAI
jgi:hypothetical protein